MTQEQKDTASLLGSGSEFCGKLTFFGSVRIEGKFEGEILSEDTLIVAAGGNVKGEISVGNLIITGGLVDAKINASHSVELHPPGKLSGEVTTPTFQIEKGAIFHGQCVMPDEEESSD